MARNEMWCIDTAVSGTYTREIVGSGRWV